jgi:hypothetical protein
LLFPVEHVIRTNIDATSVKLGAGSRNIERTDSVHGEGLLDMILAVVDPHVRRTVDNKLGSTTEYDLTYRASISTIGHLM